MKRSEINRAIAWARQALEQSRMFLPPFAYWDMKTWQSNKTNLNGLRKTMLGWDVTDFGNGDFDRLGAVLFTLRNGSLADPGFGTPYAEKLILLRHETEQGLPMHFHRVKTEDIINRGGGLLAMQLYGSHSDGGLDETGRINVLMDGVLYNLAAGEVLRVEPGCSVTLRPGMYHRFWAVKGFGDLIAGEVSSINDDHTDNVFLHPQERFGSIEEDKPALCPLCNEYDHF